MSKARIRLQTWRGRSKFEYEGSVRQGTTIHCGRDFRHTFTITANEYAGMLARFSGQEVSIGTSRTDPPNGSLGQWLAEECNWRGMTSYIGPILLEEGFAERVAEPDRIRFK